MALTKTELNTMAKLMAKMQGSDYSLVAAMYNDAQNMKQRNAANQFSVGDRVKWDSKYGKVATVQLLK